MLPTCHSCRGCTMVTAHHAKMVALFVGLASVFAIQFGLAAGDGTCLWTETNCACSLRTNEDASNVCYDAESTNVATGMEVKCTSRACGPSYVCDCEGSSYCGFRERRSRALVKIQKEGTCVFKETVVKDVVLIDQDLANVVPGYRVRRSPVCVFSDDECTCSKALPSLHSADCATFAYRDDCRGYVCKVQDCEESMVCDCGGFEMCNRKLVSSTILEPSGAVPGKPGLVYCDRVKGPLVLVTRKGALPRNVIL